MRLLYTPYWQDLETADGETLLCAVLQFYKMQYTISYLLDFWRAHFFFPAPPPSFRQGLKTLGVLEKMQMHPEAFSSILCHKPERLSAETICDLFKIHSSSDVDNVQGADFWMGYLQDVESK